MNKTIHFIASGKVQGVFFRMRTRQRAEQLGISGWVRNLSDGSVEGTASGEVTKLTEFQSWLQQGPEMACVTGVEIEETEEQMFDSFSVR